MRTVLITGGARGIGKAIAQAFAPDHAVSVTYLNTAPDALVAEHPKVHCIHADLEQSDTAAQVITQVIQTWGRIDVLVNNAGVVEPDAGERDRNWALHMAAPQALLDAARPHLSQGSAVINISSVNAVLPAMGAASYSASKAALETWTRAMAKTLGPDGIRVNAVAPGAIRTQDRPRPQDLEQRFIEMTALGRIGLPEDIARAVRFLASDDASFITGETLRVSGGYRL